MASREKHAENTALVERIIGFFSLVITIAFGISESLNAWGLSPLDIAAIIQKHAPQFLIPYFIFIWSALCYTTIRLIARHIFDSKLLSVKIKASKFYKGAVFVVEIGICIALYFICFACYHDTIDPSNTEGYVITTEETSLFRTTSMEGLICKITEGTLLHANAATITPYGDDEILFVEVKNGEFESERGYIYKTTVRKASPQEVTTGLSSSKPTDTPTDAPTDTPTDTPTDVPADAPTDTPTDVPTDAPTDAPTDEFISRAIRLSGYDALAGTYQYIYLGRFEQDRGNQPLLWRVLTVQGDDVLLLSEHVLNVLRYGNSNAWENSGVKAWLNETFLNQAFNEQEQVAICDSGSLGRLFLLSKSELSNPEYGFSTDEEYDDPLRRAKGTTYALDRNLFVNDNNQCSTYYTRSVPNATNITTVNSRGSFGVARVDRDDIGIRPAMWVNLQALPLQEGDGTAAFPYQP